MGVEKVFVGDSDCVKLKISPFRGWKSGIQVALSAFHEALSRIRIRLSRFRIHLSEFR